jgi:predicted ATP-grasp superfamily ATP-dependent carboligase
MHGRLGAVVPYPDEVTVRRSFDKLDLLDAARRAGLGAPNCTEEPPTGPVTGPVGVKSRWHWDPWRNDEATRLEATVAGTADEVATAFAAMRAAGGAPILQEYLEGEHLCMVLLRGRDGGLLGAVHQRIDRRWPVPAGWTVRAHTLAMDPDLRDASVALLEDLGWTGLVELEFIRPTDGVPRLIDFNGRFYGSMELAVAAGVDLPTLWAADATGRPVHPAPPARPGVRFQRLGGDLRRALRHPEGPVVPAVVDALRYSVGARHSTLSLRDPRPALEYLIGSASGRRRR